MNLNAPLTDKANALECLDFCQKDYGSTTIKTPTAHFNIDQLPDCLVVSARGSWSAEDWMTDSDFLMCDTIYGSLHTGFWESTNTIIPMIHQALRSLPSLPIIVTGHSLGGDQACITALDLVMSRFPVHQVITFGQARPGGSDYKTFYDSKLGSQTARWVDARDIVPRLPFANLGYANVGQELFLPSSGGMKMNPTFMELLHDDVVGTLNDVKSGRCNLIADHTLEHYRDRIMQLTS